MFSDADGTLVHYPELMDTIKSVAGNQILKLPASATGMQGIISSQTLAKCQELRQTGIKFVLVSGMRTSTLLKRDFLSAHCVCLCDDDNDLVMASVCQHAFLPGISSESMAKVVESDPEHFSQTGGSHHEGIEGTLATERGLSLVLQRIGIA